MPLDRERSQLWEALGIGPQWILREAVDPLLEKLPPAARRAAPNGRASDAMDGARSALQAPVGRLSVRRPAASSGAAPRQAAQAAEARLVDFGEAQRIFDGIESASWEELAARLPRCEACILARTRMKTVFADGAPGCPIVMVGEAPGAEEDMQGKPFVGKSGQLLSAALDAVGIVRGKDAAIINVLKCRPPGNRDPRPEEVAACRHYLDRQLELLSPRIVVLMGRPAASAVLGTDLSISRLRGETHYVEIAGRRTPVIVTYHPSYLLRQLSEKAKFWHDLVAAKRLWKAQPA